MPVEHEAWFDELMAAKIYLCVSKLAGVILVIAAFAKLLHPPVVQGSIGTVLSQPTIVLLIIHAEVVLGIWLLSGVVAGEARIAAGLVFGCMSIAAACETLQNQHSCGCFGSVETDPLLVLVMDALLCAGFVSVGPAPARSSPAQLRVAGIGLLVALTSIWLWRGLHPVTTLDGDLAAAGTQAGNVVVLDTTRWAGVRFPLIGEIDVGQKLRAGQWLVALYHADCSTCRQAVPAYEQMASSHLVALLQMPPYATGQADLVSFDSRALVGRLDDRHEWFAQTPVVLLMQDGVVSDVAEGEQAVGLQVDWTSMKFNHR